MATVRNMWYLGLVVGAAILTLLATRGDWRRLIRLPLKGSLFFVAGVLLQAALEIFDFAPSRIETTGYALLMLSYVFLLSFCFVNLPIRGMWLIALGIGLNALVIGLNVGMPTKAVALDRHGRRIERPIEQTVKHRPSTEDDILGFLGDQILLPSPANALVSIGDIVLGAGICVLVYFGSHDRGRRAQRPGRAPRRSSTRSSAPSTRPS